MKSPAVSKQMILPLVIDGVHIVHI